MEASMKNGSVMAESVPPKATPMAFLVNMFGLWLTTTRVPSSANSLTLMPAPKKGGQNPMKSLSWRAEKWAMRIAPCKWWSGGPNGINSTVTRGGVPAVRLEATASRAHWRWCRPRSDFPLQSLSWRRKCNCGLYPGRDVQLSRWPRLNGPARPGLGPPLRVP